MTKEQLAEQYAKESCFTQGKIIGLFKVTKSGIVRASDNTYLGRILPWMPTKESKFIPEKSKKMTCKKCKQHHWTDNKYCIECSQYKINLATILAIVLCIAILMTGICLWIFKVTH